MTDRFYPLGMAADADAFRTTYEVQNGMQPQARSPYLPGTAVHQPGTRELFGYSSPKTPAHRMTKSMRMVEEAEGANGRASHAMPNMQEPDDRVTFHTHDTEEMVRSYRSPVATATLTGGFGIKKTRSLPSLAKTTAPPRVSTPPQAIATLEDEHFVYLVPKSMQNAGRDKLHPHTMSKLSKTDRISFPFSGEGTGFRSQGGSSDWMPGGSYQNQPTTYRTSFSKPPFFKNSPLGRT